MEKYHSEGIYMVNGVSHGKRHPINSIRDHKPITGDHDENAIVVMDSQGLPVKDSGIQLASIMGGLIYKGTWNASTNVPVLADGTGVQGNYYVVSVPGIRDLGSGPINFTLNDWVLHNGTIWEKADHMNSRVTSVLTYYVSQNGNDTTGDGTIYLPLKTVQKAVDLGIAAGYNSVQIIIDTSTYMTETVTIPDGAVVSIATNEGVYSIMSDFTFIVGNAVLSSNNIYITLIKESAPGKTPELYVEECFISAITSSTGGLPTGTTAFLSTTWTDNPTFEASCNAMISCYGNYHNVTLLKSQYAGIGATLVLQDGKLTGLATALITASKDAVNKEYAETNINLTGATPVNADMLGYPLGKQAVGIGTGGRVFFMTNRGTDLVPIVKYVEMS